MFTFMFFAYGLVKQIMCFCNTGLQGESLHLFIFEGINPATI